MKFSFFGKWMIAGTVITGTILGISDGSNAQPAPSQSGFWCDTSSGTPSTLYRNLQGGVEPWIRWTSNTFAASGWDPLTRCQEVSARLETYRRQKRLNYITIGRMNNLNVICTASQVNGRCEGLIYTLKPGQDPIQTLNNFLAWREGQAGTPSLYESTGQRQQRRYIDVRARLGQQSEETVTPTVPPTTTNVEPVPQPQRQPQELREL